MLLDSTKPTQTRLLSFFGLVAAIILILLGVGCPSYYYTTAALLALPSPFLFVALIFSPKIIGRWPWLRFYLYFCFFASILCYVDELIWLKFPATHQ
jgi:hypothetical protein